MAKGKRPDPFRTRKLSLSAPMVLHGRLCGRVGRRRTYFETRPIHHRGWASLHVRTLSGAAPATGLLRWSMFFAARPDKASLIEEAGAVIGGSHIGRWANTPCWPLRRQCQTIGGPSLETQRRHRPCRGRRGSECRDSGVMVGRRSRAPRRGAASRRGQHGKGGAPGEPVTGVRDGRQRKGPGHAGQRRDTTAGPGQGDRVRKAKDARGAAPCGVWQQEPARW